MVYQYNDSLSWTLGKHNLKMGATVYLPMRNLFQDEPGMRGDLTFTNAYFVDQRLWLAPGFVEDDWKATRA